MMHTADVEFTSFFNIINNERSWTTNTRNAINPATETPNEEVPVSTQDDLNVAVRAACEAFNTWSTTSFDTRRNLLFSYADAIETHHEGLSQLLTREQGKPLMQARGEVSMAIQWAREMPLLSLDDVVLRESTGQRARVIQRHIPMGVVGAIVPWNFPVLLAIGKIVSAVYTGNTVIVKPSPFTPYCGLKLGEIASSIFPPGVIQVLSDGGNLGPLMTAHQDIRKISFTGSTPTGKRVMADCASTLKSFTLELGGNDPAIICDDVDVEAVVPQIATASFLCSSQICMMIKRLYVHENVYDSFLKSLVEFTRSLKMGNGKDPEVFFGPVQNDMQYAKVRNLVQTIESEGLKAALGGNNVENQPSKGYFIAPTIIDNPPSTSRVVQEEAFGPVLPVIKWSSETDVLFWANDSECGLGASVWSRDMHRANRMAARLEAGCVWINSHFRVAPDVPFGGVKSSGIGREWGLEGLKNYCHTQSVWIQEA